MKPTADAASFQPRDARPATQRHGPTRLACLIAAPSLLGLLLPLQRAWFPGSGTVAWLLDLAAHWQPAYAASWLLACALGARRHRRWLMGLPVALLPLLTSSRTAEPAKQPADLIVAVANVQGENGNPRNLLRWLQGSPANIVVVSELTPAFAKALEREGFGGFRHQALHPLASPPGIGILADRPLRNVRIEADRLGALRLEADFDVAGMKVLFAAVHPKPPNAVRKHVERDRLVRMLARPARNMPTIVAGDINGTPWSSALVGAHSDSLRRATGSAATYPTELRGWFGVAIDHVLVSPHFTVVQSERGPDIGSDHFPVRAGIRLQDQRNR